MKRSNQWRKLYHSFGNDSNMRSKGYDINNTRGVGVKEVYTGEIEKIHSEPEMAIGLVGIRMMKGGKIDFVPFPGASFVTGTDGKPSTNAKAIHGLYESPVEGQQVAIGFIEGNSHDPIILQKYPYNPSPKTEMQPSYVLPLTKLQHDPSDVILGHYSGSYIALRGKLPIPGAIEIEVPTDFYLHAATSIKQETEGNCQVIAAKNIELKDTNGSYYIKIDAENSKIDIVAGSGADINITTTGGGKLNVNSGNLEVL